MIVGHYEDQCDLNLFSEKTKKNYLSSVKCFKCREFGHYAKKCPRSENSFDFFNSDSDEFDEF